MILFLVNIGLLGYLFYRLWRKTDESIRKFFWPALGFKLIAGLLLGLLYSNYYATGDTFHYHHDGSVLANIARADLSEYFRFLWNHNESAIRLQLSFSDARALFFVKLTSFLCLITGNNYWLASVYCSTIAFIGTLAFVQSVNRHLPDVRFAAIVAFMFLPSVVFWSSGLIKESVACGALFYLTAIFVQAWFNQRIPAAYTALAFVALWIVWALKYYYVAIFIPVAFAFSSYKYVISHITGTQGRLAQIITLMILFLVPLVLFSFAHPNFYYRNFLEVIVANSEVYSQYSSHEDLIHYHSLKPNFFSILMNAPLAFISGLFRPFVTEAANLVQWLAAVENLVLVVLTLWTVVRIKKQSLDKNFVLVVAVCLYITLLCVFLALSTPNFGTLSRYRVGYLPYFVMLLLCEEKVNRTMQRSFARLFG